MPSSNKQPIHSHKSRQIQITKNTQTHKHASITYNRELQPRDSEKTPYQHNRVNVYTWLFAIVDTIPNTRLKNENGLRYSYAYFRIRVLLFDDEPSKDDTTSANITMSCWFRNELFIMLIYIVIDLKLNWSDTAICIEGLSLCWYIECIEQARDKQKTNQTFFSFKFMHAPLWVVHQSPHFAASKTELFSVMKTKLNYGIAQNIDGPSDCFQNMKTWRVYRRIKRKIQINPIYPLTVKMVWGKTHKWFNHSRHLSPKSLFQSKMG